MASSTPKSRVYRLRRCPAHLDRLGATKLLSQALGDISFDDIQIQSLATDLDPRALPQTKVGTLVFRKLPKLIEEQGDKNEWKVSVVALEQPLLLDVHFLGMTPFNDVKREQHEFDCLAISGLASHPFGSWQGTDKLFMWIRDELPRAMPNTRAIIYGYDTLLKGSSSFQSIQDVAASLIDHMKVAGWAMPSAKSLVFLAHSLGGIILKEAFTILAAGDERGSHIVDLFKGGIFFGVPSQGMVISHLLAIVKGQPNESLIHDLSTSSGLLRSLDNQFSGLASTRSMCLHWAYETKLSPTVLKQADGSFSRTGPAEILVSKESATRSLYESRSSAIFPINESHSDMVKFREDDANLRVVMAKLQESSTGYRGSLRASDLGLGSHHVSLDLADSLDASRGNQLSRKTWDMKHLISSLSFDDQTHRMNTIDENFEHTFEWIFDTEKTPMTKWLKEGKNLFWIHGKPGSGKSTLMKFVSISRRTSELLQNFSSRSKQVSAAFFFHDRGSILEKSFEGLLRSLLCQILKAVGTDLAQLFSPLLQLRSQLPPKQAESWIINDLKDYLHLLLQQTRLDLDLFLLLDALDEYDGQPEFINRFLKDLVRMAAHGRTKVKILFSSRSWDAFRDEFGGVPSIQLQDYTKDDIRKYCFGAVDRESRDVSVALDPIVPELIRRAEGVFLWVKLALYELANEARQGADMDKLANTLNSTPSDLQEYYTRIIQRVPESLRWDAYVVLSVLTTPGSRSLYDVALDLECSRQSTYQQWRKSKARVESVVNPNRFQYIINRKERKRLKSKIRTSTGNLAQLIRRRSGVQVELAHQTVKEYVLSTDFKQCVLGPNARQTQENVHSFLAKSYCARLDLHGAGRSIADYEMTTGLSWNAFFDTVSPKHYTNLILNVGHYILFDGPLGYSAHYGMLLYLKEAVRNNPDALRTTRERLFSAMLGGDSVNQKVAITKFLFANGYTINQDPGGLYKLLRTVDDVAWDQVSYTMNHLLESVGPYFLPLDQGLNEQVRWAGRLHQTGLHTLRTVDSVRSPLKHGAEVNARDIFGWTPLDHTLCPLAGSSAMPVRDTDDVDVMRARCLKARLLLDHGGIALTTTKVQWEKFLHDVERIGAGVEYYREIFGRYQFDQKGRPIRSKI
ncbi:hypothetical protein GGR52DRAFT_305072 [Hypoxylon sp. FL1284]|nr:hypothetical protein GGR52DRAFT_305072 [Hypoxylon sp. FL1284]